MTLRRLDNIGIVVEDLAESIDFFLELGMELEGKATVGGPVVDAMVGLDGVQCDLAVVRTGDGHGRLELMKFHAPISPAVDHNAPVNALGIRRIMFAVEGIEDIVARLRARGAEMLGELVRYENSHRFCYLRGPGGVIIALAEAVHQN
ncbi:VOC family protein [Amycolatopsis benzoatilytica]|uniref:VOC family protein n=1 Tax=Amycolatopsis benzoatilytica TaxID=346045 RepID=UPI0004820BA0|nr:VOC family protein [Amycolatopsis benzoatilytica]